MEVACAWAWPVRFDDRLRTVLDTPADDPRDSAVRWRQLVELIAREQGAASKDLLEEAIREIRAGAFSIDEQVRIAAARAVASQMLPPNLVSIFAADKLTVAAPVLAAARLTALEWGEILSNASIECRRFIQALRSEPSNGSPSPPPTPEPTVQHQPIPSISEVVARIERLRQSREPLPDPEATQPPDPAPDTRLFRWEADENGVIAWVDGVPRGPLIGRSIIQSTDDGTVDRQIERAVAAKVPFHDAKLELTEGTPVAGSWMISGTPAFDPSTGRFTGYRGVAERDFGGSATATLPKLTASDPDSLRDLAHEIKTPLNAIIGFAEIISGQYLGPAHHPYRERAAEIATQAHLLLTAIEDLDLAAKLHSRPTVEDAVVDLGILVEQIAPSIRAIAESRSVKLEAPTMTSEVTAAVELELAERLVSRMCTAVVERGSPGESLRLGVESESEECRVSITRPRVLKELSEEQLFGGGEESQIQAFPLRLTRGLAKIAGARLIASDCDLSLVFPKVRVGDREHGVYL